MNDNEIRELFPVNLFTPAGPEKIRAYEERYKTQLCDDFASFLQRFNGLNLDWWRQDGWNMSSEFDDDLEVLELKQTMYGIDAQLLYGIGNGAQFFDLTLNDEGEGSIQHDFFHPRFLPHMQLVGSDKGGNKFVQVARGRRKGQIYLVDHEMYYGGIDKYLDPSKHDDEIPEKFRGKSLEDIDTTELIDDLAIWAIGEVADSFKSFFDTLAAYHGAAKAQLREKYLIGK